MDFIQIWNDSIINFTQFGIFAAFPYLLVFYLIIIFS